MKWRYPLSDIDLGREEERKVLNVLRTRWLSTGPVTEEYEKDFLTLYQFLLNIDTAFILPYEGFITLVKVFAYAHDCLDGDSDRKSVV
jgi:hypothetical protein